MTRRASCPNPGAARRLPRPCPGLLRPSSARRPGSRGWRRRHGGSARLPSDARWCPRCRRCRGRPPARYRPWVRPAGRRHRPRHPPTGRRRRAIRHRGLGGRRPRAWAHRTAGHPGRERCARASRRRRAVPSARSPPGRTPSRVRSTRRSGRRRRRPTSTWPSSRVPIPGSCAWRGPPGRRDPPRWPPGARRWRPPGHGPRHTTCARPGRRGSRHRRVPPIQPRGGPGSAARHRRCGSARPSRR